MVKSKKSMFVLLPVLALVLAGCGKKPVDPTSVVVSSANDVHEIVVGETLQLSAVVLPEGAKQDVVWTTTAESVATVNAGLVTAVAVGQVEIKATAKDFAAVIGKFQLEVKAPVVLPTSVSLSAAGGASEVKVGKTLQLSAAVLPAAADQAVEFSSSDVSVATVDAAGLLTALKAGPVKVTAAAKALPSIKDELNLTVKEGEVVVTPQELWEDAVAEAEEDMELDLSLLLMPKQLANIEGINYDAYYGSINIPKMTAAENDAYRIQLVEEAGFEEALNTAGDMVFFAPGDVYNVNPDFLSAFGVDIYIRTSARDTGIPKTWADYLAEAELASGLDLSDLPNPFADAKYTLYTLDGGVALVLSGGTYTQTELLAWEALMETLTESYTTVFDENGYASFISIDETYEVFFASFGDGLQGLAILVLDDDGGEEMSLVSGPIDEIPLEAIVELIANVYGSPYAAPVTIPQYTGPGTMELSLEAWETYYNILIFIEGTTQAAMEAYAQALEDAGLVYDADEDCYIYEPSDIWVAVEFDAEENLGVIYFL